MRIKFKNINWILVLCIFQYTISNAQKNGLVLIKDGRAQRQFLLKGKKEMEFTYERNNRTVKVIGYFKENKSDTIRVTPSNSLNYLLLHYRQPEIPHLIPIKNLVQLKSEKDIGKKLLTLLSIGTGLIGVTAISLGIFEEFEYKNTNKELIQFGGITLGLSLPIILMTRKKTYKIKHGPWSIQ